jgi:predicted nucleic acid-binding protein
MHIVIDTSVVIAVLLNAPEKGRLVDLTTDASLVAPHSMHWEIGNAFSAMFKRKIITLEQATTAIKAYKDIPIQFCDVNLEEAVKLSKVENIYAYDAYFIVCAHKHRYPLISLDSKLISAAKSNNIRVLEA